MLIDDALAVLGLDGTEDNKSARRAYLRLLKKHKPDQDPEGFQRLREAYEAVEGRLPWAPGLAFPELTSPPTELLAQDAHTELQDQWAGDEPDDADDVTNTADFDSEWYRLDRIETLIDEGEVVAANALLEAEVDSVTGGEGWQVHSLLRHCLALMGRTRSQYGEALLRTLLRRVKETGSELTLSNFGSTDLIAMKELVALPEEFDGTDRAILARVVLDPHTADVGATVHFSDQPEQRKRLAKLAPALTAMIESEPEPMKVVRPRDQHTGSGVFRTGLSLLWLGWMVFRVFQCTLGGDEQQADDGEIAAGEQSPLSAAARVCAVAPHLICKVSEDAANAARLGQCEIASSKLQSLSTAIRAMSVQRFSRFSREIGRLRQAIRAVCTQHVPP